MVEHSVSFRRRVILRNTFLIFFFYCFSLFEKIKERKHMYVSISLFLYLYISILSLTSHY